MNKKLLPMAIIDRLPNYYKYLSDLMSNDIKAITSHELSEKLGLSASQIRRDFNNFGYLGRQGYGYNVELIYNRISSFLGVRKKKTAIIIGVGNLGQAIAYNVDFDRLGFNLKCMFDVNSKIINQKIRDIEVKNINLLESYLRDNCISLAILCTTKSSVQDICNTLVESEVKGIWNFTQVNLQVTKGVIVENICLLDSLLTLSSLIQ